MTQTEIQDTLDDTVALLMERHGTIGHLTQRQAEETVSLFINDIEKAIHLVDSYFSVEREEREILYGDYNHFLETIRTAILGSTRVPTLYEQEVRERASMLPRHKLYVSSYKDRPQRSGHFWEHLSSQEAYT